MMYDPNAIREFYNAYGDSEWNRLDSSAYSRVIYHNHMHFLKAYMSPGIKLLDAGCGGGRFSIAAAENGCKVTCVDISDVQLEIAKAKLHQAGLSAHADFLCADITDLQQIQDESFDTVICYGAVLNYIFGDAAKAVKELMRVTKHGGTVLFSVNNLFGILRSCAVNEGKTPEAFWGRPEYWLINEVIETGNLPSHEGVRQPPRHIYRAEEFKGLLESCGLGNIVLGASPSILSGLREQAELLEKDAVAWQTILETEDKAYCLPLMAECGEFLLAKGTVLK
jgi:ubiquinone/menaquinone biosynthesis C-methylase UbiE